MKSLDLGARLLQSISDATAYLATALLVFDQAIASLLDRQSLLGDQARITVLALIVASLVVSLKLHERNLERMTSMTADRLGGVEDLVPSSQAIDLRGLMSRASKIRILSLAGTKLALLGDDEILKLIINRERDVVLLLGNPRSDLIRLRYERDEPDTYETGPGRLGNEDCPTSCPETSQVCPTDRLALRVPGWSTSSKASASGSATSTSSAALR